MLCDCRHCYDLVHVLSASACGIRQERSNPIPSPRCTCSAYSNVQNHVHCEATFGASISMVLSILHMLNRGAPPFMRLRAARAPAAAEVAFGRVFKKVQGSNDERSQIPISLLRDGDRKTEVVFVPVEGYERVKLSSNDEVNESTACFWCYRVEPGAMGAAIQWITSVRMPLVLDLDDTLVYAQFESSLKQQKREKVSACVAVDVHLRVWTMVCCLAARVVARVCRTWVNKYSACSACACGAALNSLLHPAHMSRRLQSSCGVKLSEL
jgi:hypothetical protein